MSDLLIFHLVMTALFVLGGASLAGLAQMDGDRLWARRLALAVIFAPAWPLYVLYGLWRFLVWLLRTAELLPQEAPGDR